MHGRSSQPCSARALLAGLNTSHRPGALRAQSLRAPFAVALHPGWTSKTRQGDVLEGMQLDHHAAMVKPEAYRRAGPRRRRRPQPRQRRRSSRARCSSCTSWRTPAHGSSSEQRRGTAGVRTRAMLHTDRLLAGGLRCGSGNDMHMRDAPADCSPCLIRPPPPLPMGLRLSSDTARSADALRARQQAYDTCDSVLQERVS